MPRASPPFVPLSCGAKVSESAYITGAAHNEEPLLTDGLEELVILGEDGENLLGTQHVPSGLLGARPLTADIQREHIATLTSELTAELLEEMDLL